MSPGESGRLRAVQAPIIAVVAELIRQHPGTISLGQGVVGYGAPRAAQQAIADLFADPANHKYQATAGIAPLLSRIETKLAAENRIYVGRAHGNRVMVTAGSNMAFMHAVLAIGDPGDEFILPTPCYFNHEMAITMANCQPVLVPTDRNYQLDLDALRAAITPRTKAIVTVSPNNPTGAVYPERVLRELNQLCGERGIFHVHDEAYESFTYDGIEHFSPAEIPGSAAHTVSLFSLSKAYGFASWRIGWAVYPERLEPAMRKIQDTVLICPPVISQFAAVGALNAGSGYIREQLRGIAAVRSIVQRELTQLAREGVCEVPEAGGAFYFLLRVRTKHAPLELAERLIREHGVAVIPGSAFGLQHGCHLRVSYGALTCDTAADGIERLARGLRAAAR